MADLVARRLALCGVLVASIACTQTQSKPDENQPLDLVEVYNLAARAYAEQNWKESEKHYVTLTREAPGEAEPWFKLGNIYARTQRPEFALKAYRETLVRDPRNVKAWHNMAIIQLREAAESFSHVEQLAEEGEALHKKSVKIQRTIGELVN